MIEITATLIAIGAVILTTFKGNIASFGAIYTPTISFWGNKYGINEEEHRERLTHDYDWM